MTDYNAMSLDELEAHAYSMPHTDICDFAAVRWELVKRRVVRDAILDLAEQLDAEGLVVVPKEPTPAMRLAGAAEKNAHRLLRTQWKAGAPDIYLAMIAAAPLPASPSSVEGA